MAKLNARGREEWVRLEQVEFWPERGKPDTTPKIRYQRAYMSDGHVLVRTTWFTTEGKVDFHQGWHDLGKYKTASLDAIKAKWIAQGYQEVAHVQAR